MWVMRRSRKKYEGDEEQKEVRKWLEGAERRSRVLRRSRKRYDSD